MDISLIATAVITAITPYFVKGSEKFVESAAEDFYKKLKSSFKKSEDKELLERIENQSVVSAEDFAEIKSRVVESYESNNEFRQSIHKYLNLNSSYSFLIENTVRTIEDLMEDIDKLHKRYRKAGAATMGDYENLVDIQKEKILELQKKLFSYISKV